MKKLFFLPFIFTLLLFTSCELEDDCKDCTPQINWTWDDLLSNEELQDLNEAYQALGYQDADDYYNSLYQFETEEFCGEDLQEAEDLNETVAGVYSITLDCQ
mgnify:CR=1 FL=1|tara:strand:+ start:545 stop:850 length:306 start_codon:yes stop_codon:yes gene_type:complete